MLQTFSLQNRSRVATPSGEIAYLQVGSGPAALFIHGVFFNAELWRNQLGALADARHCVAPDLLAHGQSDWPTTPLTLQDQATMLLEFLDALALDVVDVVANDTGGAIAQLIAAQAPSRVRSLVLTNCDMEGHLPPAAFQPIVDLARDGALAEGVQAIAVDAAAAREVVAMGFEHPEALSDAFLLAMFGPFVEPARAKALEQYVGGMNDEALVAAHDDLVSFAAPTLVVWGTGDSFFGVEVGHALTELIGGARTLVEISDGRLFYPLERASEFNVVLRDFWLSLP
jgi:pimeloyl-ACP methyl ester carboxylesterase